MPQGKVFRRVGSLLLWLGPVTTLVVSPYTNYDPINPIKLIVVTAISFSFLGLLLPVGKKALDRLDKHIWLTSILFVSWMCLATVVSSAPFGQQLWGVFGRNTGLLTYLALMLTYLGCALVQEKSFYHKLVESLVLTSVPMTIYAILQIAGQDPIAWSVMQPFATLGNINFSSAFFGLAALSSTMLAIGRQYSIPLRIFLIILSLVELLIVLETGSIQGFMIYVAGFGVGLYLFLRSIRSLQFLRFPYLILGLASFVLAALALFNQGPLARFIFQSTILFRFDYWYAGWMMSLKNPIFGLGPDSYGDWYRQLRGEVATTRTGPDRITNTAHNIYLDISASGGFPLLVAYLALLFFGARAGYRVLKRTPGEFNPYFVALFASWIAYLIQAGVSINQVGVGIWGWLFSGALVGYEIATRQTQSQHPPKGRPKKSNNETIPAASAILGIFTFGLGFVLAFIPFRADSNFRASLQKGDVQEMIKSVRGVGSTAYHWELVLDAAIKKNDEATASAITRELLQRFPRDFMAWRVKQVLADSTPEERRDAFEKLKIFDPYNTTITPIG